MPYSFPKLKSAFEEVKTDPDSWVFVSQNEFSTTFITDRQRSLGSVLLLPNQHVVKLTDLSCSQSGRLLEDLSKMVRAIMHCFNPDGFHVWTNTGVVAGQSMGHLHIQIVPRYKNQDYSFAPSDDLPMTCLNSRRSQASMLRGYLKDHAL